MAARYPDPGQRGVTLLGAVPHCRVICKRNLVRGVGMLLASIPVGMVECSEL